MSEVQGYTVKKQCNDSDKIPKTMSHSRKGVIFKLNNENVRSAGGHYG